MDMGLDTLGYRGRPRYKNYGLTHKKEVCDSCDHRSINGIRFTCTECPNYSLCAICYGDDEHDLNHSFLRYLDVNSESVQFSPRRWSLKWPITGIFVGAEVVRGPDWINGNEDGGYGSKGYIIKIKRNIKTNGNYAIVTWDNGFTNDYQLDFQYLKQSETNYLYYYYHMPILAEPDYSQCPPDFPDHNNRNSLRVENCQRSAYIKPGSGKQKGYLIIFNQEEFAKKEDNRKGSRIDETTICRIFWKFNLSAVVKRNLTFSKIKSEVHKLRVYDFSKYTCFVAVIMSHGHQNGRIYAYDNDFHVDNDFIHPIISNATLKGKPKIFIIAACKGSGKLTENGEYMQTDSVSLGDSQSIPTIRDVLKCFSTYEGFVSYRDPSKGTIFIQTFCDVLDKEGDTLSVEDIMKKVNTRLTEGHASNKQVPTVQSTMSAHFYFGDLLKKY